MDSNVFISAWEMTDAEQFFDVSLAYIHLLLFGIGCWLFTPEERNPSFFEQRMTWESHEQKHSRRGTFKIRLRMSPQSFDKLLECVGDDLMVNETMAKLRGGSITPEICLYCTLRWLAGGSHLDISDIAGISKSSFYRVAWKTIRAMVNSDELAIRWPDTPQEIQAAIEGFASISTKGVTHNCVGAIDGYLLRISTPRKKEVGNVRSFFSGHHQCHGVNLQAVVDHHSRFICLAFAAAGVTGDHIAIKHCGLHELIEALPHGMCVMGDAAYDPTEHMVPVHQGADKLNKDKDNFNFYASQCRIRVEMAFGMMQMKWGILQRPITSKLKNVRWMTQAIGRLHNFCITERLLEKGEEITKINPDKASTSYLPSMPHDENGDPISLNAATDGNESFIGCSELREHMVKRVKEHNLVRPAANRLNKKRRTAEEATLDATFDNE